MSVTEHTEKKPGKWSAEVVRERVISDFRDFRFTWGGFFRWTGRIALVPVGILYALIVFFTQFTAWRGIWSLYEQHAFLLPVPFVNM